MKRFASIHCLQRNNYSTHIQRRYVAENKSRLRANCVKCLSYKCFPVGSTESKPALDMNDINDSTHVEHVH